MSAGTRTSRTPRTMGGTRPPAPGEMNIDRAVYAVDDDTRTYRYLERNPDWRRLDPTDNERNKRRLAGYTRVFPDGRRPLLDCEPPHLPPRQRTVGVPARAPAADPAMTVLHDTVIGFAAFARAAPARRVAAGRWGVHEVLAHLVYWHEHYVRVVRAQLTGRRPWLPEGTFRDLNTLAVAHLRAHSLRALASRLADAQSDLERLSRSGAATDLRVTIKEGSKPWPWAEFVGRVASHIRNHEDELRRDASG